MAEDLEGRIFAKVKARTPLAKELAIRSVQAKFLGGSLSVSLRRGPQFRSSLSWRGGL